jgi:hypothetical protein
MAYGEPAGAKWLPVQKVYSAKPAVRFQRAEVKVRRRIALLPGKRRFKTIIPNRFNILTSAIVYGGEHGLFSKVNPEISITTYRINWNL